MGRRRRSILEPTVWRRGELSVERDPRRPSGRLLRQGEMDASYVDLADPTHLEFDYLRWIRIVLRVAGARRVLHVGGGACALARALAAEDPGGRQEVCELSGEVLTIAREQMGLRRAPGLHVRQLDGRDYVQSQPRLSWDAIVVDAFDGAIVPRHLITAEAFVTAARVAALTLVNVVDNRDRRDVRLIAAGLAASYPQVWALGGRVGNTVVVGVLGGLDLTVVAARAAAGPSPARLTTPAALAAQLVGSSPLHDHETGR